MKKGNCAKITAPAAASDLSKIKRINLKGAAAMLFILLFIFYVTLRNLRVHNTGSEYPSADIVYGFN